LFKAEHTSDGCISRNDSKGNEEAKKEKQKEGRKYLTVGNKEINSQAGLRK
jgi:hypothetical protein